MEYIKRQKRNTRNSSISLQATSFLVMPLTHTILRVILERATRVDWRVPRVTLPLLSCLHHRFPLHRQINCN